MSITLTPGWVNITSYVRKGRKSIDIVRGKQHELSRIETSTMKLTVQSPDDRFNPNNAAGAYYPHVTPTTPIRLVAEYEGADEHLWRGYAKGWPQRWTGPGAASTQVLLSCTDVFGIFSRMEMRSYAAEVLRNQPLAFWMADETAYVDLSGNGHDITWNSNVQGITQYGVPLLFNAPQAFVATTAQYGTVTDNAAFRLDGDRSITAWLWVNDDNDGDGFATIVSCGEYLSGDPRLFQLKIATQSGRITIGWGFNGVQTSSLIENPTTSLASSLPGTHWLHVGVTWNEDLKRARLYINGELVEDKLTTLAADVQTQILEIGRDALTQGDEFGSGTSANVWTSLAIYDHELAAGAMDNLYHHRIAPYSGGPEIVWWNYFPLVDWPVNAVWFTDDDDSGFWIGTQDYSTPAPHSGPLGSELSSTVLSELRRIADGVNSSYHVDTEGRVQHYHDVQRSALFRTPVAAYTDDGVGLGYRRLVMPQDDSLIRNIWEVTPDVAQGGGTQRVYDQSSIDAHGPKTQKVSAASYANRTTPSFPQSAALSRAQIGLAGSKDARTRVDRLTIQPGTNSGQWDALFSLDLHRRVSVTRTPPGGSAETNELVIQKMKYKIILDGLWVVDLQLSPTESDDYWMLGVSTLGETTKLAW